MVNIQGDAVVVYIDSLRAWLGVNVLGDVLEVALTSDELETVINELTQVYFRMTSNMPHVQVKKDSFKRTTSDELSKKLMSGILKEK